MQANSKLPSAIFDSIMSNPLNPTPEMTASLAGEAPGSSILEKGNPKLAAILGNAKKVMEQAEIIKPTYTQPTNNGGFNNVGYDSNGEREMPSVKDIMMENIKKKNGGVLPTTQAIPQQQIYQQPQPQPQVQSGGIDYSLIKMMIESAVSSEFQKISGKLLTEGKSGKGSEVEFLTIGKTIKFVDKNGNVYEGIMKKTGNIN
jgi:hypothetical protein